MSFDARQAMVTSPTHERPRLHLVSHLSIAALVLAELVYLWPFTVNDTFITMTYAANLLRRGELSYIPGTRVEGFTSPLWVLVSAGWMLAGVEGPVGLKLTGAASTLLLPLALYAYARRVLREPNWWGSTLIAVNGPLLLWAPTGMETSAAALGVLAALYGLAAWRSLSARAALLFVAYLIRPETALVALVSTILLGEGRILIRFLALVLLHLILRHAYFGAWLPNTFWVKTNQSLSHALIGGCATLLDLLRFQTFGVVVLCALAGLLWRGPNHRMKWALAASTVAYFTYCVFLGPAPSMSFYFRYWVPTLPLLLILAGSGLAQMARRAGVGITGLIAAIIVVLSLRDLRAAALGENGPKLNAFAISSGLERAHMALGHWLHEHAPPATLVAAQDAGALAYYSRLPFLDLLGLNDATVAAGLRRRDADAVRRYFFARDPAFVVIVAGDGSPADDACRLTKLYTPAPLDAGGFFWLDLNSEDFRQRYVRVSKVWTYLDHYHLILFAHRSRSHTLPTCIDGAA